jgi:peptidoglycan/LPS O-acetylase OafA/YrhL
VNQTAEREGFLDSVRAISAVIIVGVHFFERGLVAGDAMVPVFGAVGKGAVMLFFFVSGFALAYSSRRMPGVGDFFTRRIFRVFPLYWFGLSLILVGALTGITQQWTYMLDASLGTWLANLFIVQDFVGATPFLGISWTLAIEFVWYTLFFVALRFYGERAAPALNLGFALLLLLLALASVGLDQRIPLGRPGMVYACALGFQAWRYTRGQIAARALLGWSALFLAVTTLTNVVAFGHFQHSHSNLGPVLISWTAATLLFLAIVMIAPWRRSALLNRGPLPAIGVRTYSIYLLHPVAIALTVQHVPSALQVPAVIGLTTVLALIGYHGIEEPGQRLGKRVATALGFAAPRSRPVSGDAGSGARGQRA